ncbi:phage terminase small subunit [Thermomonospora cellulosilytica]|uniref:Terminase small subunit n=1 Tax=Thermomonospora cellulosilytica TaxID=1411118 RepID=A0A7W3MUB2_9ACTN|nr:hypothetical protein [Thermomonospora cellulosilytica]MBA9002021.1 hypothetical protein [Thermomonospora cellulosilytica]
MPGMGPPPAERKRRRNADTFENAQVTVPAEPSVDAPPLPNAKRYLKATRDWYATWCRSPVAAAFTATDWQRLHMLAPLVDQYWRGPSTKLMAEIRISESLLGATHVDRMRGRIKVQADKPAPAAAAAGKGVADLTAARRKRMTDAS